MIKYKTTQSWGGQRWEKNENLKNKSSIGGQVDPIHCGKEGLRGTIKPWSCHPLGLV